MTVTVTVMLVVYLDAFRTRTESVDAIEIDKVVSTFGHPDTYSMMEGLPPTPLSAMSVEMWADNIIG